MRSEGDNCCTWRDIAVCPQNGTTDLQVGHELNRFVEAGSNFKQRTWSKVSTAAIPPVFLSPQHEKSEVFPITIIIESGIWSKPVPHDPCQSFTTMRFFTGAILRTERLQTIYHPRRSSTISRHTVVYLVCCWSGFCRAGIGGIRCTAATQFYASDSRYLSSSNHAARATVAVDNVHEIGQD